MATLYGPLILQRFRAPRFRGTLEHPDATAEDVNPLCGDRVRVEVRLIGGAEPHLEAVRYQGDACAVALAAADVLAELVEGRPVREALEVTREQLMRALAAEIRPSRLGCVSLPLAVLGAALRPRAAGPLGLAEAVIGAGRRGGPGGGG